MDIIAVGIGGILFVLAIVGVVGNIQIALSKQKKIFEAGANSVLFGTVSNEKTFLSPITQTTCVYCRYQTFQRGKKFGKGPRGTAQSVFGSGIKRTEFYLEDETGKILIIGNPIDQGKLEHQLGVYDNDD